MSNKGKKQANQVLDTLIGQTAKELHVGETTIWLKTREGETFLFYHEQDCCEAVYVEDINGDMDDLLSEPILMAEEVTSHGSNYSGGDESYTWTFYKIATKKGTVTIRWYGTSNGYYSESVSVKRTKSEEEE